MKRDAGSAIKLRVADLPSDYKADAYVAEAPQNTIPPKLDTSIGITSTAKEIVSTCHWP